MAHILYDYNDNKVGSYEGNSERGKVYNKDGNYAGEYWGHEIFDKNGMSVGAHNGDPERTVQILLMR